MKFVHLKEEEKVTIKIFKKTPPLLQPLFPPSLSYITQQVSLTMAIIKNEKEKK